MRTSLHHLLETGARSHEATRRAHVSAGHTLRTASSGHAPARFAVGLRSSGSSGASASPSSSTSGSRRSCRSSAPRPPAACSCRSTRCLKRPAGRLHPRRLRRPGPRHDRRAPRAAARCARGLPGGRARRRRRRRRSRTGGTTACQLHAWTEVTRTAPALVPTPRDRHRHGGDPLHVRQHGQAEGRRALATAT